MSSWDWLRRHEPRLRRVALGLGVALVLVQWASIIAGPRGDFGNHWLWAQRLVRGQFIYEGGFNIPYMPFWALWHVPLLVMPLHLAQVVVMPIVTVGAIAALLASLRGLGARALPVARQAEFWIAAGALALAIRYVMGDMTAASPGLMLTALVWCGFWLWTRDRPWLGGALVGLAVALKLTALIFLPYLLYRRAWKLGAATVVAAVLFTLAPMLLQGPSLYGAHMAHWARFAVGGMTQPDPSLGPLGLHTVQNMALRPALARFLMDQSQAPQRYDQVPEDHISQMNLPAVVYPLDLDPATARWIVMAVTLLLLAAVAWPMRQRTDSPRHPRIAWDLATLGVLALLLSPITWRHHCVAMIPAFYLLLRLAVARGGLPRWIWGVLAYHLFVTLVLNRGLWGRDVSLLVHAYYLYTWSFLAMLPALLAGALLGQRVAVGPAGGQTSRQSDRQTRGPGDAQGR